MRSACVVGKGGHVRGGEMRACSSRKPSASSTIPLALHHQRKKWLTEPVADLGDPDHCTSIKVVVREKEGVEW